MESTPDSTADRSGAGGGHRILPGRPVVVGVDGSPEANRGVLFAADLASRLGTRLVAVHALGMFDHEGGWETPVDEHERRAEQRMSEWCAPLRDVDDLVWEPMTVQGNPIDALLRVADDVDAGFIVLGSHGAGESTEPLLGSTSNWVVRNSHRPVVIIPPGDNHPHRRLGSPTAPS